MVFTVEAFNIKARRIIHLIMEINHLWKSSTGSPFVPLSKRGVGRNLLGGD